MAAGVRPAATLAAATAVVATGPAPAQAAWASDYFSVDSPIGYANGAAFGDIYWYNRTAYVNGVMTDHRANTNTTLAFEAYAGPTKIATETRTANDESELGDWVKYDFTIGDPNLVGGIDRIKVTICHNYYNPAKFCSIPKNYMRD
ncbi:hypothetical protein [Paractinoplanes maris]|uniref:hypothetical protein n=1 Tax=Paractinoplanes maris TaxID=1734446 RepID=UPI002020BD81|nr:hypothetical protein [Actinoplanes maris]